MPSFIQNKEVSLYMKESLGKYFRLFEDTSRTFNRISTVMRFSNYTKTY